MKLPKIFVCTFGVCKIIKLLYIYRSTLLKYTELVLRLRPKNLHLKRFGEWSLLNLNSEYATFYLRPKNMSAKAYNLVSCG